MLLEVCSVMHFGWTSSLLVSLECVLSKDVVYFLMCSSLLLIIRSDEQVFELILCSSIVITAQYVFLALNGVVLGLVETL